MQGWPMQAGFWLAWDLARLILNSEATANSHTTKIALCGAPKCAEVALVAGEEIGARNGGAQVQRDARIRQRNAQTRQVLGAVSHRCTRLIIARRDA